MCCARCGWATTRHFGRRWPTRPLLLLIASSLNGLVMFVSSVLLIRLNRGGPAPPGIGLRGGRLAALVWAVVFYGGFSLVLLVDQGKQLLGG